MDRNGSNHSDVILVIKLKDLMSTAGTITVYKWSKKKRNTPIYSNTNYRREFKLVPVNINFTR